MLKTTSQAKTYVLAHPHLGTLDNWMPVIKEMHIASNNTKFTLMVKNLTTIRSYNKKNAVVSITNDIFDEVLIHAYKEFWIRKTSVFEAINWYKKNKIKLRMLFILDTLAKKNFFSVFKIPLFIFRKVIFYKAFELCGVISKRDILLYDIHTESIKNISKTLEFFNKKISLPHAISVAGIDKQRKILNVDSSNIKAFVFSKFQLNNYISTYGMKINSKNIVGIPRHDKKWLEVVQNESESLPINFDENTVVILSRHLSKHHLSYDKKTRSLKNIKKIFIDQLGMKVVIKMHPNEEKESVFFDKEKKIFEKVFGVKNYGVTWVYSSLHVFALCKGKKLSISLNTGVVFDAIAIGVPCVEYLDYEHKCNNYRETDFVKHGFIEGVSNFDEMKKFVKKWKKDPEGISYISLSNYKKHFPVFNNISEKIAIKIINENQL